MSDDLELQAKSIFGEIVQQDLSPEQTQKYLAEACGENAELKQRIQLLLDAYSQPDPLLDIPSSLKPTGKRRLPTDKLATVLDLPPFPDLLLGKSIGPYKLLERLGEGGMGIVYLAQQHEPIRRKVALKVIKPGMDSRQVLARFEAERHALALMDHPNIARVLDGGMSETGQPYFVMEYVKGLPITKYCDQVQMSIPDRLKLFHQVCQAVQHAHQKGIIHRDLKPSNILICLYDGKPVPKVIDFGLAKALHQPLGKSSLHTAHGLMVGTPRYMSPEQAEFNNLDIDTRSDIYSLGVVLYELLTGSTPIEREQFKEVADQEILRLIRDYEPPLPSQRISSNTNSASISAQRHVEPRQLSKLVRGELDWIVMRALEKERHRRYETANGLARDIERYLSDEPVEACPPSLSYRMIKFLRRHRRPVMAGTALTAALLLGLVGFAWQSQVIRAERNATAQQRDQALAAQQQATMSAEAEKVAKQEAEANQRETQLILDFVLDKVLAAARPEGQRGGVKIDVTLREAIESAALKVEESFPDQPLVEARVHFAIGETFELLGLYNSALEHYQKAYQLRERVLGKQNGATISSSSRVAGAIAALGRYNEALEMRQQLLAETESLYGPDHPETLGARHNIGHSYEALGRYAEGVEWFEKLLPDYTAALGANDPEVIRVMHNLAQFYHYVGRDHDAIDTANRTLELWETTVGLDHPDAISTSRILISANNVLGQYEVSLEIAERNLPLCREKFGDQHPMTLHSLDNLSTCYRLLGYQEHALELLREQLESYRSTLGVHHPNSFKTMNNTVLVLDRLGRLDEALELALETRELMEQHLGPDSHDTLIAMSTLSSILDELGRSQESLEIDQQTLERAKEKFGDQHPFTLSSKCNLALTHSKLGNFDQALSLLNSGLDGFRQLFGADNPSTMKTARIMRNIQQLAERADQIRAAEDELLRPEESNDWDDPDSIAALADFADLLAQNHQLDRALEKLTLAQEHAKDLLDDDSPLLLRLVESAAHLHWQAQQPDKAIPLYETLCDRFAEIHGEQASKTLSAKANLGINYLLAGQVDNGLAVLQEVYQGADENPSIRNSVSHQVLGALVQAGRAAEAVDYAPSAYDYTRGSTSLSPNARAANLEKLATVYQAAADHQRAVELQQEALDIFQTNYPGIFSTYLAQATLGLAHIANGEHEAGSLHLQAGTLGMYRTRVSMLPHARDKFLLAVDSLIQLYEDTQNPVEAARWRTVKEREQVFLTQDAPE